MGLGVRTQRLLALAPWPSDDNDCEWIHKGVTTGATGILAAPTHHESVDHQPDAAVFPSRHSPPLAPLIETFDNQRHPDWSL